MTDISSLGSIADQDRERLKIFFYEQYQAQVNQNLKARDLKEVLPTSNPLDRVDTVEFTRPNDSVEETQSDRLQDRSEISTNIRDTISARELEARLNDRIEEIRQKRLEEFERMARGLTVAETIGGLNVLTMQDPSELSSKERLEQKREFDAQTTPPVIPKDNDFQTFYLNRSALILFSPILFFFDYTDYSQRYFPKSDIAIFFRWLLRFILVIFAFLFAFYRFV